MIYLLSFGNTIIGDKMKNYKNQSIWEEYLKENSFPKLEENIFTDVLVIGGGVAGVLIAKKLHDNNIETVLVEKNKIGRGITSKTTAFLTSQHETLYQSLKLNKSKDYLKINNEALREYKKLSICFDFDYERVDSCLFSSKEDIIKKEYDALKVLNQDVYLTSEIPINKYRFGIAFKNQGIINPIKLINNLVKDLTIYENSEVVRLKKNYAVLKNGVIIKFNKVVIATHYPINNKLNLLFMKLTQVRSYVVAVKKNKIKGTYCDIDKDGIYYRMYDDFLIIGGNDRDTGCKTINDFKRRITHLLNLTDNEIEYSWSGQDCKTIDGIPYIGRSDIFHRNHIIVTGFNLWGFTWAMASSNIVFNIIKYNKECKLTKVNRLCNNKNLFKNIKNSIVNLINFKKPRCTHLGCRLMYNKHERIWECPCHGSIYNEEGKPIIGPANKNINI